jgi:hypothetical protein
MRDPALAPAIIAGLRSTRAAVRPEMNPTAAEGWQGKEGGHTAEVQGWCRQSRAGCVDTGRTVGWQVGQQMYMLQCTMLSEVWKGCSAYAASTRR